MSDHGEIELAVFPAAVTVKTVRAEFEKRLRQYRDDAALAEESLTDAKANWRTTSEVLVKQMEASRRWRARARARELTRAGVNRISSGCWRIRS